MSRKDHHQKVRVALWGLGAMGASIARIMADRRNLEIVGAIDLDESRIGKDLGNVIGLGRALGIPVSGKPDPVLRKGPDIILQATGSFLEQVGPQIIQGLEAGCNLISIAEEMTYPWATDAGLAERIHAMAVDAGLRVLGSGVNPGFIMDTLPLILSAVCTRVDKFEIRRVNDLSAFGRTVMRTQGVGLTGEAFRRGLEKGVVVGHVGFPQSIHLIASALGWPIDEIRETRSPIISSVKRKTDHVEVEPGQVAGCRHIARGFSNGIERIVLDHPQQVRPEAESLETGDYIRLRGEPDISLRIKPEIAGGTATAAIAVNLIPRVLESRPGLLCMTDVKIPVINGVRTS